jgi:predicted transcriptional regulator
VRTTIDLPDDLHALARQLAHDEHRSLSDVVADLMRRGLHRPTATARASGPRGLPQVAVGRAVTAEDVRSLDDDR